MLSMNKKGSTLAEVVHNGHMSQYTFPKRLFNTYLGQILRISSWNEPNLLATNIFFLLYIRIGFSFSK